MGAGAPPVMLPSAVAVENDYNALVFRLNDLTEEFLKLKIEVEKRLLEEKRDGLDPNSTKWVNLIARQARLLAGPVRGLGEITEQVLHSRPGEPVFSDEPTPPPDYLP